MATKILIPTPLRPFAWFAHPRAIAIPTGVWTPLVWNTTNDSDKWGAKWYPTASLATTTIDVASNGTVLPTGTITVASTASFPSACRSPRTRRLLNPA